MSTSPLESSDDNQTLSVDSEVAVVNQPKLQAYPSISSNMGLASGVEHFFGSILEMLNGILSTILSAFQSVLALAKNLIASIFDLMSGVVGFILGMLPFSLGLMVERCEGYRMTNAVIGNIVIIGVIVAAFIGYQAYTGKRVGQGKKRV